MRSLIRRRWQYTAICRHCRQAFERERLADKYCPYCAAVLRNDGQGSLRTVAPDRRDRP